MALRIYRIGATVPTTYEGVNVLEKPTIVMETIERFHRLKIKLMYFKDVHPAPKQIYEVISQSQNLA